MTIIHLGTTFIVHFGKVNENGDIVRLDRPVTAETPIFTPAEYVAMQAKIAAEREKLEALHAPKPPEPPEVS